MNRKQLKENRKGYGKQKKETSKPFSNSRFPNQFPISFNQFLLSINQFHISKMRNKNQKRQSNQIKKKLRKAISLFLLFNILAFGWAGKALAISVNGDGDTFYGEGTTTPPEYGYYTNSTNTFGDRADAATANATINWTAIEASPTEDLLIAGSLSSAGANNLTIQQSDGSNTNWAVQWQDYDANYTYQGFDIAFEDSSGDALVVYADGTATPKYRKYDGTPKTWSGEGSITVTRTAGTVYWVKLETNPGTNTIGLAYSDSNSETCSQIWSGLAWGNEPAADMPIMAANTNGFDLGWEASDDDLVVVSTKTAVNGLHYSTWDGANWTVDQLLSNGLGANQASVRVAGNPVSSSNCVVVATLDNTATTPDLHMARWNGGGWTVQVDQDTSTLSYNSPHLDLDWAGSTGQAFLVYSDVNTGLTLTNYYANNSACNTDFVKSTTGTAPTLGAAGRFIQADSDPTSSNILYGVLENTAAGDLSYFKYTYALTPNLSSLAEVNYGASSPVTTDTSTVTTECFSFAFERLNLVPTLTEILFLALVGCVVFLGIKRGVIKIKKDDDVKDDIKPENNGNLDTHQRENSPKRSIDEKNKQN